MARKLGWVVAAGVLWALSACGSGSSSSRNTGTGIGPPLVIGHWTYYGQGQSLSADVRDVSADEGGNVYVAGGDALYAKKKADPQFHRFDASNAGLTKNCNDPAQMTVDNPTTPFTLCPVISVAGAAPGKVFVGLEGFGIEADQGGATWAIQTGGADVVSFDGAGGTAQKQRHVFIASPPHVVCGTNGESFVTTCDPTDPWWNNGRRLFRQVMRIAVNHDPSSVMYGDAWMGGNHATFSVLLNNAAARGYNDRAVGAGPQWADAIGTWEHLHPAIYGLYGEFLVGETHALSIDPRNGQVWGSNGIRTAYVTVYPDLTNLQWWMGPITFDPTGATSPVPYYDLWPDSGDPWSGPTNDHVQSVSHCMDGTLWVGSTTHGLARIDPGGAVSYLSLPDASLGNSVNAVACDPSDASVWIGLGSGGLMRYQGGTFAKVAIAGAPAFAGQQIQSIQVDRWSSPTRVLYFAFGAAKDGSGRVEAPGGVAAYDGP